MDTAPLQFDRRDDGYNVAPLQPAVPTPTTSATVTVAEAPSQPTVPVFDTGATSASTLLNTGRTFHDELKHRQDLIAFASDPMGETLEHERTSSGKDPRDTRARLQRYMAMHNAMDVVPISLFGNTVGNEAEESKKRAIDWDNMIAIDLQHLRDDDDSESDGDDDTFGTKKYSILDDPAYAKLLREKPKRLKAMEEYKKIQEWKKNQTRRLQRKHRKKGTLLSSVKDRKTGKMVSGLDVSISEARETVAMSMRTDAMAAQLRKAIETDDDDELERLYQLWEEELRPVQPCFVMTEKECRAAGTRAAPDKFGEGEFNVDSVGPCYWDADFGFCFPNATAYTESHMKRMEYYREAFLAEKHIDWYILQLSKNPFVNGEGIYILSQVQQCIKEDQDKTKVFRNLIGLLPEVRNAYIAFCSDRPGTAQGCQAPCEVTKGYLYGKSCGFDGESNENGWSFVKNKAARLKEYIDAGLSYLGISFDDIMSVMQHVLRIMPIVLPLVGYFFTGDVSDSDLNKILGNWITKLVDFKLENEASKTGARGDWKITFLLYVFRILLGIMRIYLYGGNALVDFIATWGSTIIKAGMDAMGINTSVNKGKMTSLIRGFGLFKENLDSTVLGSAIKGAVQVGVSWLWGKFMGVATMVTASTLGPVGVAVVGAFGAFVLTIMIKTAYDYGLFARGVDILSSVLNLANAIMAVATFVDVATFKTFSRTTERTRTVTSSLASSLDASILDATSPAESVMVIKDHMVEQVSALAHFSSNGLFTSYITLMGQARVENQFRREMKQKMEQVLLIAESVKGEDSWDDKLQKYKKSELGNAAEETFQAIERFCADPEGTQRKQR